MDIEALRSFLAFAETGSFTRAAKQINRTQSAFSAQMRKLEDELEVSLFQKEGRHLVLSEAGLSLRTQAQQIIGLHESTVKKIRRYQDKRPLKLGCPEDYNDNILPHVVAVLQQAKPTFSIQIYNQPSSVLRTWLDEGNLDAAIVTRAPGSEEGHWLASDQGVWIASETFELQSQSPLPLALFQADCKYHAAAIEALSKVGHNHQLMACCNTASAQRALVKAGLAVGAMGRRSVGSDLRILDHLPPLPNVDIALITSVSAHPLLNADTLNSITARIPK